MSARGRSARQRRRETSHALDPVLLASKEVDAFFNALISNSEGLTLGGEPATIDNVVASVETALESEHKEQHGPITEDVAHEIIAREAGYLVGVQVGLRLRGAQ